MILCIGATPAAQRVMVFPRLNIDAVNRATTTLDGAAGKAVNVAKVLKALGQNPVVTGFLGGDRGEQLRQILAEKGVVTDFVAVPVPTRQCITIIDQAANSVTELVEESRPVPAAEYDRLWNVVVSHLAKTKAVVMSGTITPGGPVDFYARCTLEAKAAGCLVIVDAQGPVLIDSFAAAPDLVKPNRTELAASVGRRLGDEPAVIEAMRELRSRGPRNVVVTDGGHPALAYDGAHCWRIHPARIQPINPIGSGDAFTAGLLCHLLRGDDLAEACRWGAAAGAANALTLMAGEVQEDEVLRLARHVRMERIA